MMNRKKESPGPQAGTSESRLVSAVTDPAAVIRRARRPLVIFGGVTLVLWGLVAAVAYWAVRGWFVFIYPRLVEAAVYDPDIERSRLVLKDLVSNIIPRLTMAGVTIWASLLVLAAISTLVYISYSRRVTLRQLQASLNELSAQLKALSHGERK